MRTIEIVHRTRYDYAEPVTLGEYRLMFRPRDSHDLRLLYTHLGIVPAGTIRWIHDAFGNSIAIAAFTEPAQVLEFVSTIRLGHYETPSELPSIEAYAVKLPFSYAAEEAPDLARYIERQFPDPNAAISLWAKEFVEAESGDTFATLGRMCAAIHETFGYNQRFEPGTQGEHKVARGFVPTLTHSAHRIADPRFRRAIADYLRAEGASVDEYAAGIGEHVPYRQELTP